MASLQEMVGMGLTKTFLSTKRTATPTSHHAKEPCPTRAQSKRSTNYRIRANSMSGSKQSAPKTWVKSSPRPTCFDSEKLRLFWFKSWSRLRTCSHLSRLARSIHSPIPAPLRTRMCRSTCLASTVTSSSSRPNLLPKLSKRVGKRIGPLST